MTRYALLSVSDKSGIEEVAKALVANGLTLLSTGGTFRATEQAGIPVEKVEDYTRFPEILDGRVKTLHPKIHGGLLGLRDNEAHRKTLKENEISFIDYVIVNLYPFKETIKKSGVTLADAIENIDIGGPSMLRSAAKNYQSVTVVTDPKDYDTLIDQLQATGETSLAFRAYLAQKVFALTSHYDTCISQYLAKQLNDSEDDFTKHAWDHLTLTYEQREEMRYGENSHQKASFYKEIDPPAFSIAKAKQHHGKALSYNNLKDADAAMRVVREFDEPAAIAMKHMNPCGVGTAETIEEAFDRAYTGDPVSIYGGIVAVNRNVTLELAEQMAKIFLEIVIAPSFDEDAYERLAKKKNLRILTVDFDHKDDSYEKEYVTLNGGILEQDQDHSEELSPVQISEMPADWNVASNRQPTEKEIRAMNFAMKVVKHIKSNAIVVTNENMVLGVGSGQPNRIDSFKIAIQKAEAKDPSLRETLVVASDAFLPKRDNAEYASEHNITAIIQPGGSKHDDESIAIANEKDIAMVMTGKRHFRH
ncbi:MAG: bifunctional phosphoribosylaminoimidazolecarboxamide formyltransferase/IMP cyclohydrolase [Aerococcus sp.]|nr:bifunctional phosphoribosylaminoimidazolecarboxamide formyltransferase/IMP cyclohydrolase [Aerococcus sp.]